MKLFDYEMQIRGHARAAAEAYAKRGTENVEKCEAELDAITALLERSAGAREAAAQLLLMAAQDRRSRRIAHIPG